MDDLAAKTTHCKKNVISLNPLQQTKHNKLLILAHAVFLSLSLSLPLSFTCDLILHIFCAIAQMGHISSLVLSPIARQLSNSILHTLFKSSYLVLPLSTFMFQANKSYLNAKNCVNMQHWLSDQVCVCVGVFTYRLILVY